jgi:VIT1/CCC1 family predicted Fe2+/Mn2+ transporter
MQLSEQLRKTILQSQQNEINEHSIYRKLADGVKDSHNKDVLMKISREEKKHYLFWKKYSKTDVKPQRWKIWFYYLLSRVFGITFAIKKMEHGEENAQQVYSEIAQTIPEAQKVVDDEDRHEHELIQMLDEDRLKYTGAIIRGFNDALMELIGVLAGFTFILGTTSLIGLVGLIIGGVSAFTMAGSEYLATQSEHSQDQLPKKAAYYTTTAYLMTVALLVGPYFFLGNVFTALSVMAVMVILIKIITTYYTSVILDQPFKRRLIQTAIINISILLISFTVGYFAHEFFGIEI